MTLLLVAYELCNEYLNESKMKQRGNWKFSGKKTGFKRIFAFLPSHGSTKEAIQVTLNTVEIDPFQVKYHHQPLVKPHHGLRVYTPMAEYRAYSAIGAKSGSEEFSKKVSFRTVRIIKQHMRPLTSSTTAILPRFDWQAALILLNFAVCFKSRSQIRLRALSVYLQAQYFSQQELFKLKQMTNEHSKKLIPLTWHLPR